MSRPLTNLRISKTVMTDVSSSSGQQVLLFESANANVQHQVAGSYSSFVTYLGNPDFVTGLGDSSLVTYAGHSSMAAYVGSPSCTAYAGISSLVNPSPATYLDNAMILASSSNVALDSLWGSVGFGEAQLTGAYAEVGEALALLAQSDDEDYSIDPSVYSVATYVAAGLAANAYCYPAPSLFTHGSDSVVFNWTNDDRNLYVTVASDGASLLVSTPDRIEKRADFTLAQLRDSIKFLPAIHSQNTQLIVTTEGDVEPIEVSP